MILRCFVSLGIIWLLCSASVKAQDPKETGYTRIAFGSCNNQLEAQPLWMAVVASRPDLWVWLGDNIYADTDDMQKMESYYRYQLQRPEYQQLLQMCPVTGIWSDHDFAGDNADKSFKYKEQSQQLFLDFMGVAKEDTIRQQEGIYRTWLLGEGKQQVKIILLDALYHRDPLKRFLRLYIPDANARLLGEAQWAWLEQELLKDDASVHIIASDLQVLPNSLAYTNWSAYPTERKRLLKLLEKTKPAIPIILSGDRHVGELSKVTLKGYNYPLYEITSSGMTHFREAKKGGNRHRVGEQVGALNFGLLQINWQPAYTSVSMQIRGENNKLYVEQEVTYPVHQTKESFQEMFFR